MSVSQALLMGRIPTAAGFMLSIFHKARGLSARMAP